MSSRAVGLEGARVRLPSGRWLDEIADPTKATANEVAWVVARTMFSHADGERFYGNIEFALELAWDKTVLSETKRRHMVKGMRIAAALHRNGFIASQQNSRQKGERFFWQVPTVFPVWDSNGSRVEDDGSQTTGGPVSTHHITTAQVELMRAIEASPDAARSWYAEQLGWVRANVGMVARTLEKHGYIKRLGKAARSRYHLTGKPFPYPNGAKPKVVVTKPKPEPSLPVSQVPEVTPEQEIVYDLPAGLYTVEDGRIVKFTPRYKVVTL